MNCDDMFLRFLWRDRGGLVWTVEFIEDSSSLYWCAKSEEIYEKGLIFVQTHDIHSQKLLMAHLVDVRVDAPLENRGMGSMLVREAVKECKRRGHKGMDGYLSYVDKDHFPKLKYFYEKLGFSVKFNDAKHSDYKSSRAGKIEIIFDNVLEES